MSEYPMQLSSWTFGINWSVAELRSDPMTTPGYRTDDKLLLYKSMFSEKKMIINQVIFEMFLKIYF